MRRARSGPARCGGFTLIEVLVALAIASVALLAAIRATGTLTRSAEELRWRTLAQWSAENRLASLRLSGDLPAIGRSSFDCRQAEVALTCQQEVFGTPHPLFRRVEIQVIGGADGRRLARMVSVLSKDS